MQEKFAINGQLNVTKLKGLRGIYQYLLPYKWELLGVFLALIFTSSAVLGFGKGLEYLIDEGFAANNPELLDNALIILIGVVLLLAFATYVRSSLIYIVCEKVVADMRRDVYEHIIRLSPGFFEMNKTSDVISRLTADTTLLNALIANVVSVAARNMLLFLGGLSLLIYSSPKLTLYVFILVPLTLVPIMTLGRKVRKLSRICQDKISDIGACIEESLNSIKVVQAYTREDYEINLFNITVRDALNVSIKRVRYRAFLVAIVISFVFVSIGTVMWVGGHDVLLGKMSAGQLSSFIFYSVVVAGSVGALTEVLGDIQRASGATERLFELIHTVSHIRDPHRPKLLPKGNKSLEFKNVSFSYPARPETDALSAVNFKIEPGQTIAIVGASGAGKTSIFQLLLRFYEVSSGSIELDGIDIQDLKLEDLRGSYAYVSQEPVIFSTSAKNNIGFGDPNASLEEIRNAAKAAEILDFLDSLPQGINTFLGERGTRISGGQAQRIAIARAVLKDPDILLLDEATSALDSENEKKVQKALHNLMKGRTSIIIAHRISTIKDADLILVLDQGKLVERGRHEELMQQKGIYHKLASMQETDGKNL